MYPSLEKDCKQAIKKTKNLLVERYKDIKLFRKFWKKSVNFRRYVPSIKNLEGLDQAFGQKSLFLLYKEGKAYSGAIFLRSKKIAYYWQAFTNRKARKKLAQYQIVWQGINWAKKEGCKYFDFEGIYDPRFPNHSWLGFTHFKKSFGGKEKNTPALFLSGKSISNQHYKNHETHNSYISKNQNKKNQSFLSLLLILQSPQLLILFDLPFFG